MFDFCPGDCNEPITARGILEGYNLPQGVIDEALMAHAHELAEEIRELMPYEEGIVCADFIDPEVEK
ncbi:hypothetical protein [Streptomyces globisporus]|uniref:hypothetical protein n=1 Tax=Streptomyces globisporus TaxID=1908 RepID=UPI0036813F68